jgi:hypothetical protein
MKKRKMKRSLHFSLPFVSREKATMRDIMPQYLVATNKTMMGAITNITSYIH